ncbi:anthranilate phosphoribosyltransferase [Thermoactinospora rubra]|uniref:anthranilate phosphoribosyltransferase n=1 Tax=Thermoactinospora rubra TaxID=1088767 RepID=UPI000A11D880|nr:anthranilate phosphoribosyltransferase [Thermoactinospora rubra]
MIWKTLLPRLLDSESLTADEAARAMAEIVSGRATDAQIAAFAVALRAKGETPEELTGLADAMLARSTPVGVRREAVDLVGSGGDMACTVNVSTMAAVVAAATGVTVVKHGGRAASSSCGAADLLEELGVAVDLPPERAAAVVEEVGIGFLFAPLYHPALRHASPARREIGVPTVFNLLGPLINPARPRAQAVGVAHSRLAPVVAEVFARRGCSSLVFRGDDGLDELTTCAPSTVWLVRHGRVAETRFDAADLGIPRATHDRLRGGDAVRNAETARAVLAGRPGPVRDIVLLNAAAAMVAAEGAPEPGELAGRLAAAYGRAAEAVDSGAAGELLERWVRASRAHFSV